MSNSGESSIARPSLNVDSKKSIKVSGLRKEYLSFTEVFAQAIALIAPSATPALVIPLVFATAGNGTWLAYLFALLVIALVAANVNEFTKRSASPGSLYAYVVKGLGANVGVVSGWALVLAYFLCAGAVLCGFINYADVLLKLLGISFPYIAIGLVGAAVCWYIAFRDIKLSARIMLAFETVSLVLIFLLAIIVLVKHGFAIDHAQLTLSGVSATSIRIGLVLAFFSYTGFESAASLGDEAKKPLRTIPKAILGSAIFVGLFFIILSYTEVLGFIGSSVTLDQAQAPLANLADYNGVHIFGTLISIGAMVSFWACFLACINAGARVLFSMGQHKIFFSSIGDAHETNKTPHIAITVITLLSTIIPLILVGLGNALFDIYGWIGTLATFGFLLNYGLIALSVPAYLHREKELRTKHIVLSVITVLVLLIPIVGSVYPLPAYPYNLFPFIFVAWLIVGGLWLLIRNFQSPGVGSNLETSIETIHQHFRDVRAGGDGEGI